jgi:hypothetical protein
MLRLTGILAMVATLALAGCGGREMKPIGTGSGRDQFPKSPCACDFRTLPQPDAGWFERMERWASGART